MNHLTAKKRFLPHDIFSLSSLLHDFLRRKGVHFDASGFPTIPRKSYIATLNPDTAILPVSKRWFAQEKEKTILCFYEPDAAIWCHLRPLTRALAKGDESALRHWIAPFQGYYALGGADLSISRNTSFEVQEAHFLLNQLLNALFAVYGLPLIPNFRFGSMDLLPLLTTQPKGTPYAVGVLGCRSRFHVQSEVSLRARLLLLQPTELLIYGTPQKCDVHILKEFGVPFRVLDDYHKGALRRFREGS